MDIREIYAEKLRAMSDRARYRDFYDFYLITQEYRPDFAETISLLMQKEIRKPVSQESILSNWKIASKDRSDEMDSVYYEDEIIYHEERIEELLIQLKFESIVPKNIE